MPRYFATLAHAALFAACAPALTPATTPPSPSLGSASEAPALVPSVVTQPYAAASAPPSADAPFRCTEVIGLTITAEWYGAGFEALVPDARFQARTRPHTFVDQWADATHEAWAEPITSPCTEHADAPDRVVLFAANWKLASEGEWTQVLEAFVSTVRTRYPNLRELDLFTVLRGPGNQTCGDPKSVVDPMIDAAIARVAHAHTPLVHAGPKLEAPDCAVFEEGGPHFTGEGRKRVAELLARTF